MKIRLLYRLAVVGLLSACAVGPDYVKPDAPTPAQFKEAGNWVEALPRDDIERGMWWKIYKDPVLNGLEQQVIVSNQNLKAAEAAYRQASAVADETEATLFPTLSLNAGATRAGNGRPNTPAQTTYTLGPTATWVPDVWGRIRRGLESDEANAQASAADLASATLSAQAALATDYFDLRAQDELKRLLDNTVEDDTKALTIVKNQYEAGIAAKADVVAAETQLDTVKASAINAGVRRAQLEHAIAVLVGKAPGDFALAAAPMRDIAPVVPAGLPSTLLERRPDIASAERLMNAANAQIGVAVAAWYPNITLSASYGYSATALSKLFQASNSLWSFGPQIAETIFDAGAREDVIEQARAGYDESVATYRQTVLTAFQQVEDNLAALQILSQQADVEKEAVASAHESERLTFNQYKEGIVPYSSVLTAQTAALSNEQTALGVKQSRLEASVALIQALGGGWSVAALPQR